MNRRLWWLVAAGLCIGLATCTLLLSGPDRVAENSKLSGTSLIGISGIEPTLPPNLQDQAIWEKQVDLACKNTAGETVTHAVYLKVNADESAFRISVLNRSGVRVAIRAGYFDPESGKMIQVAHVRNPKDKNWIRYDWSNHVQKETSRLRLLDELGMSAEQFLSCFSATP